MKGQKKTHLTFWGLVCLVLLAGGAVFLGWGFFPLAQIQHTLEISPAQMSVPGEANAAVLENRRITLAMPAWVRLGETIRARLTFEALPGEPDTAGLHAAREKYVVFVESRLDLPEFAVEPAGVSGQVLPEGKSVVFWWQLKGVFRGESRGTAWLSLRFEPLDGGEPRWQAVAAPRIRLEVSSLLGLSGPAGRYLGVILWVAALFLGLWRWKLA